MTTIRVLLLGAALACIAPLHAAAPDLESAFARFWSANDPSAAARAATDIVKLEPAFDEVYARLQRGRTFSTKVVTGLVQGRRTGPGGAFKYTVEVPAGYDPTRKYQVRIQLHGGVNRQAGAPRGGGGIGRLAGAEQIYILPQAWNEAPWWSDVQLENIRAILDSVKRTYNVDEDRVAVAGVSDGGTGAYYIAMRDPTPYASFLPLNGYLLVLSNRSIGVTGDLFPTNLRNRPFFVVNGGRDPLYPTSAVEPYLDHLHKGGVSMVYRPQPQAGHDTSWWPQEKDAFEAFVRDHPREPLPDRLTWESSDTASWGRADWVVIDALGGRSEQARTMVDLNDMAPPRAVDFGIRITSGLKLDRVVKGSSADRIGLAAGDTIARIDDQAINSAGDIVLSLQAHPIGSAIRFTVTREGRKVVVAGLFTPTPLEPESKALFEHRSRSGRIDLQRTGNLVEATTRGLAEFTLLLSPDRFDFSQPIKVTTNGHVAFDGVVDKSVKTLLKWAARDNDRTMLFAAEIRIKTR